MKKSINTISFDIYDTLIQRIVSPKKIYEIISKKYAIPNFTKIRLDAEAKVRKNKNVVYKLSDIYNEMDLDKKIIFDIMETEKQLEIKNTIVNPVGFNLYKKYRENYKIICVSDMYFSTNVIKKILDKNGYSDISNVFVSCDCNKSKKNGNIFSYIIKELNIKKRNICHIGDSIRSDYLNPKLYGISSYFIGKNNKNNYSKKLTRDEYLKYIGYKIFGPVFFEMCHWIHSEKKNSKLLFVAREGEILYNFYSKLYNDNSEVIYISRKSVLSGISYKFIKKDCLKELLKFISIQRDEKIGDLIKRLGINSYFFSDKLITSNVNDINVETLINEIKSNKVEILDSLKEKSLIFDEYIRQNDLYNITFVDVGWNGSMQNLLNNYFKIENFNLIIKGLYLGTLNKNNKKGLLFNSDCYESSSMLNYSGIVETILMPNHGSIIGYEKNKSKVTPIFDKNEFSDESQKSIEMIQSGIENYICDLMDLTNDSVFSTEEVFNYLNSLGLKPNKFDVKYFGSIEMYDNGKKYLLVNSSLNFKKDFLETKWKIGYLKKIFKVNINYNKLLNFIRKVVD